MFQGFSGEAVDNFLTIKKYLQLVSLYCDLPEELLRKIQLSSGFMSDLIAWTPEKTTVEPPKGDEMLLFREEEEKDEYTDTSKSAIVGRVRQESQSKQTQKGE